MTQVPCGTCTRCCTGPVMLHASLGDDIGAFEHKVITPCGWALPTRPDGKCIYLNDRGCSIYEKRPAVCRAFDCRVYAKQPEDWDIFRDEAVATRGRELIERWD